MEMKGWRRFFEKGFELQSALAHLSVVVERFCVSNNFFFPKMLSGSNLPSKDKALECPVSDSGNEH